MQNELNTVLNPIAQALSVEQQSVFTEIGESVGLCARDMKVALQGFYNAVMVEVSKDVNGVTKMVKEVDYYLWEQGRNCWQQGYAKGTGHFYMTSNNTSVNILTAISLNIRVDDFFNAASYFRHYFPDFDLYILAALPAFFAFSVF